MNESDKHKFIPDILFEIYIHVILIQLFLILIYNN